MSGTMLTVNVCYVFWFSQEYFHVHAFLAPIYRLKKWEKLSNLSKEPQLGKGAGESQTQDCLTLFVRFLAAVMMWWFCLTALGISCK